MNIFFFLSLLLMSFAPLRAEAPSTSLVEKMPVSVFWSNVGTTWVLETLFEEAEVKTFFTSPPPPKGIGIAADYLPVKQDFYVRSTGQRFQTEHCRYIQHLDGIKTWGFSYDVHLVKDGKTYDKIFVFISEKPELDIFYLISEQRK